MKAAVSIVLVVLVSALAVESCLMKSVARMRVQAILRMFPDLADEIRNGQLGPNQNSNGNYQNQGLLPNNNQGPNNNQRFPNQNQGLNNNQAQPLNGNQVTPNSNSNTNPAQNLQNQVTPNTNPAQNAINNVIPNSIPQINA